MNEASKIAENKLKSAVNGEEFVVKSLWENQDCVITFFRRFGWPFCRLAAKQLSGIKPKLDAHNVRLVGIGVEELGVQEFMDGKFFDGDLFIDTEKKCFKDMSFKRYGMLNLIPALFAKTSRDAVAEAKAANLGGDLKGDYYQVGGTLVVTKGGDKVLLCHKQESLADHVDPSEVLKSLNIEVASKENDGSDKPEEQTKAKE